MHGTLVSDVDCGRLEVKGAVGSGYEQTEGRACRGVHQPQSGQRISQCGMDDKMSAMQQEDARL